MAATGIARPPTTPNRNRIDTPVSSKGKEVASHSPSEPCAATAPLLLLAQGSSVLCLHYDTLAVERRFQKHTNDVVFIAVDNVSETGQGRLVVTYDEHQTAIVWDLFTGEQIARFASYEPLKVASWMRNGNIAFGNAKGEVILFEPSTSDHVSTRTIFDPITAVAPSSDCKTYAIGYNNGTILLAALQPSFTILHTLSTSRAPSPITYLTWHASSTKQKSDMLASQTADGDLRVWSVSKPPAAEIPRVIRVLKRNEPDFVAGRNFMSWSKNGRIIQYSEMETLAWDVRTKNISSIAIPLVDGVRGIACHGPSGSLFTLGPDYTVQQYEVESRELVRNVRHLPMSIPPTPPEENRQLGWTTSESEEDLPSPFARARQELRAVEAARNAREQMASPQSYLSGTNSAASRSSRAPGRGRDIISPGNRTELTGTSFSLTSQQQPVRDSGFSYAQQSPSSARAANRKASRLRKEVVMSPGDRTPQDLFPFTRARLSDVPYKAPRSMDEINLTPDDLRRQMLSVVFGWEGDIETLLRDEISRHSLDSPTCVYLSKWLEEESDSLAEMMGSSNISSGSEWMLLALGNASNHATTKKITQVFIEKMLSRGEIHAAATLLFAVGDRSDAIEVYVSRNQFLEAVLLTCIVSPQDWQRISHLVRRWGEHVVENSQQQLAIRCFSCTGVEPTEPWSSPTAQFAMRSAAPDSEQTRLQMPQYPDIFQKTLERRRTLDSAMMTAVATLPEPAVTPPKQNTRRTPQTSALKLITSFGAQPNQYKFPGLKSDDRTPTYGAVITPIAESAIDRSALSPGGTGSYRLNNVRSLNNAMSARTATPGAFHRHRLPSIGESPVDPDTAAKSTVVLSKTNNTGSGSDKDSGESLRSQGDSKATVQEPILILSSARYDPTATPIRETPMTAVAAPATALKFSAQSHPFVKQLPEPDDDSECRPRTGSRSRKPDGLSIQTMQAQEINPQHPASNLPGTTESLQTTHIDTTSDLTSGPSTGDFYRSPPTTGEYYRNTKSPSISGRSLDQYISSLDQAQFYRTRSKTRAYSNSSKTPNEAASEASSRQRLRASSQDFGNQEAREIIPGSKRSPSSPVPMSPEDIRLFSGGMGNLNSYTSSTFALERVDTPANLGRTSRKRSNSTKDNKSGHRSRSRHGHAKNKPSDTISNRQESLERSHRPRGRSSSQPGIYRQQSPSSPLPTIPFQGDAADEDAGALRLVNANRRRHHRSTSRKTPRDLSSKRDESNEGRRLRTRSRSLQGEDDSSQNVRRNSINHRGEKSERHVYAEKAQISSDRLEQSLESLFERQANDSTTMFSLDSESKSAFTPVSAVDRRKKELAAAELEARRLSLVRRPSAPNIPLPGQTALSNSLTSTGNPPPLIRASTDNVLTISHFNHSVNDISNSGSATKHGNMSRTLSITPKMRSEEMQISNVVEGFQATTYQSPNIESRSGRRLSNVRESIEAFPKHPAYDSRIASSRSSSKTRENRARSQSRGTSRDRARTSPLETVTMVVGSPNPNVNGLNIPSILPELQHLVAPPPPPPPPPPKEKNALNLRIESNADLAALIPLPQSAYPSTTDTPATTTPSSNHRRGRSGHDSGQFMNKIRSLAGRARSSSRGPDNISRSPQPPNDIPMLMPYETTIPGRSPPPPQMQSFANVV